MFFSAVSEHAIYCGARAAASLPALTGMAPALAAAGAAGRAFGALRLNRVRVDRATDRLAVALPALGLPDFDHPARRELVLNSYEHLAKLAVEIARLPRMITPRTWVHHTMLGNVAPAIVPLLRREPAILITGHTGNWEVLAATLGSLGFPSTALYRPLDNRPLDAWLRRTRARQGIHLLDKFGAAEHLPSILERREPAGFVADQNAGDRGLFVPFLGRLASSYKTIGLLAVTHNARVICGQARRDEPVRSRPRYHLDIIDVFGPEDYRHQPDPVYYITARYRRAIEHMVRLAPDQYLWMHRMWKSRPAHERNGKPFPDRLRQRLCALPWLTDADVEALVDRSSRDAQLLRELGTTRLP